jgi:hypothetical protein
MAGVNVLLVTWALGVGHIHVPASCASGLARLGLLCSRFRGFLSFEEARFAQACQEVQEVHSTL